MYDSVKKWWRALVFAHDLGSIIWLFLPPSAGAAIIGLLAYLEGLPLTAYLFLCTGMFAFILMIWARTRELLTERSQYRRAIYIEQVNFSHVFQEPDGSISVRPVIFIGNVSSIPVFYSIAKALCVIDGKTSDESNVRAVVHCFPPGTRTEICGPKIRGFNFTQNAKELKGRMELLISFGRSADSLKRSFFSKGKLTHYAWLAGDDKVMSSASYTPTEVKYS